MSFDNATAQEVMLQVDSIVCHTNVLTLSRSHNWGGEVPRTCNWVHEALQNRAYLGGTRCYVTAEGFLYYVMRFLKVILPLDADDPKLYKLYNSLKERVAERIGIPGNSLSLACQFLGIENRIDKQKLLDKQCGDSRQWDIGKIYKFVSSGIQIGNKWLLTTALSMAALKSYSIGRKDTPQFTAAMPLIVDLALPSSSSFLHFPKPPVNEELRGVRFVLKPWPKPFSYFNVFVFISVTISRYFMDMNLHADGKSEQNHTKPPATFPSAKNHSGTKLKWHSEIVQ
ncbi:hypothetical protein BDQ17DRAFT_1328331 [Cyathus striatus]|nr:hypothetical protein BDQ17DRAFT_1328331 [Cyathus striatus]